MHDNGTEWDVGGPLVTGGGPDSPGGVPDNNEDLESETWVGGDLMQPYIDMFVK